MPPILSIGNVVYKDRIWETTTAPGTGSILLQGAIAGPWQSFNVVGATSLTHYLLIDQIGNRWEVGLAEYTRVINVRRLVRRALQVIDGSAGPGTLVDFNSGVQNVIGVHPSAPLGSFGTASRVEGSNNITYGTASHAEGTSNYIDSVGYSSHAEGLANQVQDACAHAEGLNNYVNLGGYGAHVEGAYNHVYGNYGHAEGFNTSAGGSAAHAEGRSTSAIGFNSHAEGINTAAQGLSSHAEGSYTIASGLYSHAEGLGSHSIGQASHAEGSYNTVAGKFAHGEGHTTSASGEDSHAEGLATTASGEASHAEGFSTYATNTGAHSEGSYTTASGLYTHAGGHTAKATLRSQWARAGGEFSQPGDAQISLVTAMAVTLGTTPVSMIIDLGAAIDNSNRIVIPNNTTYAVRVSVVARAPLGAAAAYFEYRALIQNNAGTTALVGTVQLVGSNIGSNGGAPPAGWAVTITADDANDALNIAVTGENLVIINWVARIELVEVSN